MDSEAYDTLFMNFKNHKKWILNQLSLKINSCNDLMEVRKFAHSCVKALKEIDETINFLALHLEEIKEVKVV